MNATPSRKTDTAPEPPGLAVARTPRRQGPAADPGHPPARAHPGRRDPRAGGRGRLRPRGTGAQAVGGVPPRCGPGGGQGAQEAAQGPVGRPDGERDPRLHVFQPPGEPRRGPAPHPPPHRARARRQHAGRQHRGGPGPAALGGHRAARRGADAGTQLRVAGADRAPDGGAAQEHPGRGARHRRTAGRARRDPGAGAVLQVRARCAHAARAGGQRGRGCAPASRNCGRPGCCAIRSSRWPTRSRTRSPITNRPSCARSRACTRTWSGRWAASRWRASCAWASGSAATATAIPT